MRIDQTTSTSALLFISCAVLLLSGCQKPEGREASPEVSCTWYLESVAKALELYERENGRCPAVVVDETGGPHSWRMLILPFILREYDGATYYLDYFSYRLSEAWDSEHNKSLLNSVLVHAFHCPADEGSWDETSYLMLVRPADESGNPADVPHNAVVVVESSGCGIGMAQPKDLKWEDLWKGESPYGKGKLNSNHKRVIKAIRADGTIIDIPKNLKRDKLKQLLQGSVDP
ncbi:DUF1559 domain-containing protein [Aeoliella sp. ICT_H6.2]|uniref:DUF1559 domain-containing protein n=1 Tax=Aeoliella straminimaris TaxID=2954799 RepID=A0A9X2FCI8_9BACT|nr:DUF1559 domain-containing protein [Aeoliella straminimaris]MCO6045693.1 DUF1559 domain-containing protein [Aeoliella straminimaris]